MNYFLGIFFALFDPAIYGGSVIIDNILSNHSFKSTRSLILYTGFIEALIFLPVFFLLFSPNVIPFESMVLVAFVALSNLLYKFPFFSALKQADTSIVTALFSLGRIFVPILAFFLVGEVLNLHQYFGFILIILGGILLAGSDFRAFKFNKVFWLMLVVSFLLSIEGVLLKALFEQVDWSSGMFWVSVSGVLMSMMLIITPGAFAEVRGDWGELKKHWGLFLFQGLVDFVAEIGFTLAVSMIPITLVKGVAGLQPYFVVYYSYLMRNTSYSKYFNEAMDYHSLKRKLIYFILILFGTFMVLWS